MDLNAKVEPIRAPRVLYEISRRNCEAALRQALNVRERSTKLEAAA